MSERQTVGSISEWAGMLEEFFRQVRKGTRTREQIQDFLKGRNPFREVAIKVSDWLQPIIDLERQYHQDFFGRTFPLAEFTRTLKKYGVEKVATWQSLNLEPHFLPNVSMMSGDDYPGWKTKPDEWFYKQLIQGNIFQMICSELQKLTTINLDGITVLVDTRLKPSYGNEYENDYLGPVIAELRGKGAIGNYDRRSSRFNVSAEETEIKPEAAQVLGLNPEQLRLEREIEANVIPQVYPHMPRVNDGKTNTWEWREEFFGDRDDRLGGGSSGDGGLASVHDDSVSTHWSGRAFRFLAVL